VAPQIVLGERSHLYRGVPRWVIFDAVGLHLSRWVHLHPGEVQPKILEETPPDGLVWSSLWPISPKDRIEIALAEDSGDTTLSFKWLSETPPDARGIGITRQRLNKTFGGDIRGWLASEEAWQLSAEGPTK